MRKDELLITVIFYVLSFFLFWKYFQIKKNMQKMEEKEAYCSDVIVRRTYDKKYYMYFYKVKIDDEEISISEKKRLPFMQSKIKIKEVYKVFINPKNTNQYVSPIQVLTYKYYLILAIILIVLPLIIFR